MALEIFAKFAPELWLLLTVYVFSLFAIVAIVSGAKKNILQPRVENYRAILEMLRVQRAWWAAGLTDRVDRRHLQGADAELARPRDAVRSILGWTALRSDWATVKPMPARWDIVRATPPGTSPARPRSRHELAGSSTTPEDWVGEQLRYYAQNYEKREETALKRETLTWFFFTISVVLAFIVWFCLSADLAGWSGQAWLKWLADNPTFGWPLWVLIVIAVGLLRWRAWEVQGVPAVFLNVAAGLICGIGLAVIFQPLGALLHSLISTSHSGTAHCPPFSAANVAERLTIVVFVALTAAAGAIRFHAEKRGFEAEAFAYRDALDQFERAERAFAALSPLSQDPRNEEAARDLVRDLGKFALWENETWLKAHRERPLSPVVG